jgi:hypothetical protein
MKLSNKISIVLDYQGTKVAPTLIESLITWNRQSFPDYLEWIYLLGADLEHIKQDKQVLNFLKSAEVKQHVCILPEDYAGPLFRELQRNTVSQEYSGLVSEEIFDVRTHLVESLHKHVKLYA